MLVSLKWWGCAQKEGGPIQIKLFEHNCLFGLAIFEAELDCRNNKTKAWLVTMGFDFRSRCPAPCCFTLKILDAHFITAALSDLGNKHVTSA